MPIPAFTTVIRREDNTPGTITMSLSLRFMNLNNLPNPQFKLSRWMLI